MFSITSFSRGLLVALVAVAATLQAQPPREVRRQPGFPPRFHDPATPVKEGGQWYIFATGNGIQTCTSKDLLTWEDGPPVFKEMPKWHQEVVPTQRGHLWAPDIITHQGEHRLYYSVSSFGKNVSAIGLATNRSLDPADPDFKWKDEGIIIQSHKSDPYNAIDPHVIIDDDGKHWMSFGSFWTGIQLVELDPTSGKIHSDRPKVRPIAWNKTIEAPAILKHGDYYYLFVNWGICCRGLDSTYEIRVGRSRTIIGPYLDKAGNDLATGGGALLLGSRENVLGPGHASFIRDKNSVRMFYHFYDGNRGGYASLSSHLLEWTKDHWPEIPPGLPKKQSIGPQPE
jgi:arabinan endo-1,5-alpha-L-arabinosidase